MSLLKRSDRPLRSGSSWLSDFFEDRFFDSDLLRNQSFPAVNVRETDGSFEIELAAPGMSKKDFQITTEKGVLTISSEQEESKETNDNGYTRKEFGYSSFSRSFTLPENANADDIKAKYEDGLLKLSVAKKDVKPAKPLKVIEVK